LVPFSDACTTTVWGPSFDELTLATRRLDGRVELDSEVIPEADWLVMLTVPANAPPLLVATVRLAISVFAASLS
jgi:hypothetical protein